MIICLRKIKIVHYRVIEINQRIKLMGNNTKCPVYTCIYIVQLNSADVHHLVEKAWNIIHKEFMYAYRLDYKDVLLQIQFDFMYT